MSIRLERLGRDYNDVPALREVSVSVAAGETLVVLGPNGAGKSTLLRVLAGLLRPSSGIAEVLGATLPKERWKLRGRVGVLGHGALLYHDLTGRENLAFAARLYGLGADAGKRIDSLLDAVGMSVSAAFPTDEMSAGMLQRLALCRAILHEPELLLLDEPLSHLDPGATEELGPLIGPHPQRTRVVVTHDPEAGLAEADVVLVLGPSGAPAYAGPRAGLGDEVLASVYGTGVAR